MDTNPSDRVVSAERESVLPEIMPWMAIMVVWLTSMGMLFGVAAVAPPVVFSVDWGFGILVVLVVAAAAYATRTIARAP